MEQPGYVQVGNVISHGKLKSAFASDAPDAAGFNVAGAVTDLQCAGSGCAYCLGAGDKGRCDGAGQIKAVGGVDGEVSAAVDTIGGTGRYSSEVAVREFNQKRRGSCCYAVGGAATGCDTSDDAVAEDKLLRRSGGCGAGHAAAAGTGVCAGA